MKHSIRTKFTLIFSGLIAAGILICWGANHWYLESYYQRQKENTLTSIYRELDTYFQAGQPDLDQLSLMLEQFSERYNVSLVLVDSSGGIAFSSAVDIQFMRDKVQRYILGFATDDREVLHSEKNYEILKTYDSRINGHYLESWGFLPGNVTFIMSTPMESIIESTEIANRFLGWVGLMVVIAGGIAVFITSRSVTRSLLKLAAISERMSQLDFNVKYEGKSGDELEILGTSINKLSGRLEETISELKSANIQLQEDIKEKERIDEMRTEFLSNVSHELKTPIALIQGYAEGLIEGISADEESRNFYCEVIVDEAAKMNRIVKQLLTLNQLEFGNEGLEMERFDINLLIQGVLTASNILLEQKGITVEFHHDKELYVWADEFKVEEVVRNYLSNAINHAAGEKKVVIRAKREGAVAHIGVFNTGLPIPEPDLDKVWGKFYKVDKARTREYGGSGVGLSIVRAVMESHHRDFGVCNRDEGVEFWFELDCSSDYRE